MTNTPICGRSPGQRCHSCQVLDCKHHPRYSPKSRPWWDVPIELAVATLVFLALAAVAAVLWWPSQ